MHVGDTIFIFCLALILFGPKKLPEIGRQLGKLMVEFRRASNEFKMQIDEELRAAEYADQQKQREALNPPKPAPELPESVATTPVIKPPSEGEHVSSESPSARVVPVTEEVAELHSATQ